MYQSKIRVEVKGTSILVAMRGTCLRARYRKQEGPDDPDAPMTLAEFRGLAWTAANETAQQLGWIESYEEVHHKSKQDRM
ncbi:MAG: hypothetical protein PVG31_03835 [Methyloceanibacter sp.]|jgi:hypothetical protein